MPTDVSKSVSAVSFGDLELDANAVALAVAWTPPEDGTVSIKTYEMYLATDAAGGPGHPRQHRAAKALGFIVQLRRRDGPELLRAAGHR